MPDITNISCYHFANLEHLKLLREQLLVSCRELTGTILLSTEGINLFVAGSRDHVDALVSEIRNIPGLEGLQPKYSISAKQPFTRMLIRIKKEIIAFGVDGIDPGTKTSQKIPAAMLKQWLDEGRPITLLDTRNDYEIKLGTFKGAIHLGIDHFRQYPTAIEKLPETMKEQAIVMFCTGGIRCEKAGPFMEMVGFKNIFQLDGGILKYFEQCGGAHYQGECFVFDQRVGVDPTLRKTDSTQCYLCQSPLTREEQNDPHYVLGESCPYCFQSKGEKMRRARAKREALMKKCTDPLPGSVPYEIRRPILIPMSWDGHSLLDCFCRIFPNYSREEWEQLFRSGCFQSRNGRPVTGNQVVRGGEKYYRHLPQAIEPAVRADIRLLHEDEALIVVDKPAPLPMCPGGCFQKNTLQYFLAHAYAPQQPRPVYTLDANITGLVVWTRTRHFAKSLLPQFSCGNIESVYLVRIQEHPDKDTFSCSTPISSEPDRMSSRPVDDPKHPEACTEFLVLKRHNNGTALLEARPRRGQHISRHLQDLGFSICDNPTSLKNDALSTTTTLDYPQPPLCLHSWKIAFSHPLTKEHIGFETVRPAWAVIATE